MLCDGLNLWWVSESTIVAVQDNRSPLCFKDRRGQPLMLDLLEYQRRQVGCFHVIGIQITNLRHFHEKLTKFRTVLLFSI